MCGGALRPNDLGLLRNAQPALSITRRALYLQFAIFNLGLY